MIFEGSNFFLLLVFGLILAFFPARRARRKIGGFLKKHLREETGAGRFASGSRFEKNHLLSLKKCPNCAAQLPLAALFCEACEHNFLSGAVGFRNKMLPSSESVEEHGKRSAVARRA
jgi:predicted amidophosphoribosyltransferase